VQLTPITWPRLADALAERIARGEPPGPWWRVAVDGAPAARPADLADALAAALPALGHPALRVSAGAFWLDTGALRREVLEPLGPGGTGRALPSLRDPATDRSTRADYVQLPPGGVLVLDGPMLLGQGLPFDLTVHLRLSAGALERRTEQGERWTLPAYERYAREALPEEAADVLVRADDPCRPAWTG